MSSIATGPLLLAVRLLENDELQVPAPSLPRCIIHKADDQRLLLAGLELQVHNGQLTMFEAHLLQVNDWTFEVLGYDHLLGVLDHFAFVHGLLLLRRAVNQEVFLLCQGTRPRPILHRTFDVRLAELVPDCVTASTMSVDAKTLN